MIGIGVGIDYALFIVTRYRQGILRAADPRDAVVTSLMTSGRSVLFAGSDGRDLAVRPLPDRPAVHDRAGHGVHRRRADGPDRRAHAAAGACSASPATPSTSCTCRASSRAAGRPRRTGSGSAGAVWSSAGPGSPDRWPCSCWSCSPLPLFSMRLAFTDAGNDPTSLTTRQAYDLLAQGFGPGFNGPLVIAADDARAGRQRPRSTGWHRALAAASRGIAFVTPAQFNGNDTGAVIIALPDHVTPVGADRDAGADPP